ncbi:hypothetical protein C8J57DRAFT_1608074 [Mycena rebaudengoi]|nr:hypothetical protein C8J57DRAFT_1608074 [Mycena rebaudengoi]
MPGGPLVLKPDHFGSVSQALPNTDTHLLTCYCDDLRTTTVLPVHIPSTPPSFLALFMDPEAPKLAQQWLSNAAYRCFEVLDILCCFSPPRIAAVRFPHPHSGLPVHWRSPDATAELRGIEILSRGGRCYPVSIGADQRVRTAASLNLSVDAMKVGFCAECDIGPPPRVLLYHPDSGGPAIAQGAAPTWRAAAHACFSLPAAARGPFSRALAGLTPAWFVVDACQALGMGLGVDLLGLGALAEQDVLLLLGVLLGDSSGELVYEESRRHRLLSVWSKVQRVERCKPPPCPAWISCVTALGGDAAPLVVSGLYVETSSMWGPDVFRVGTTAGSMRHRDVSIRARRCYSSARPYTAFAHWARFRVHATRRVCGTGRFPSWGVAAKSLMLFRIRDSCVVVVLPATHSSNGCWGTAGLWLWLPKLQLVWTGMWRRPRAGLSSLRRVRLRLYWIFA